MKQFVMKGLVFRKRKRPWEGKVFWENTNGRFLGRVEFQRGDKAVAK